MNTNQKERERERERVSERMRYVTKIRERWLRVNQASADQPRTFRLSWDFNNSLCLAVRWDLQRRLKRLAGFRKATSSLTGLSSGAKRSAYLAMSLRRCLWMIGRREYVKERVFTALLEAALGSKMEHLLDQVTVGKTESKKRWLYPRLRSLERNLIFIA